MNASEKETSALKLYLQVLGRRWFVLFSTINLVLLLTLLYTLRQPKIYESSLLLQIGKEQKPQVVNSGQDDNQEDTDEVDTQIQFLRTLPIVSKATDALRTHYTDIDAKSIADNLSIKQLGKSGIVSVSYRDMDPDRLVKTLSQLGDTYVDFSLTNRRSQVTTAITFIQNRLPSAQQDLKERSQQLASFRKQNNLVDPKQVGESLSKALDDLAQQEYTTIATLRQGQALYSTLEERLDLLTPNRALALASLSEDSVYLSLLKDYQEAEKNYRLGLVRYTDEAPSTRALKNKRDELKLLLSKQVEQILGKQAYSTGTQRLNALQITQVSQLLEAENALKVQQARLSALQTIRKNLEQNFKLVPGLQREYDTLSLNVQVASENVTRLLTKLEEFRILEAQESAIWKLVQSPYPPGKPISPNLKLNMLTGLVLGLMLGGLLVYVFEQLDERLHNPELVNQLLQLRTLGVIPKTDETLLNMNKFSLHNSAEFINAPAFRPHLSYFQSAIQHLFFTLRSLGLTESLKAMGVTSSTSGEGKSTIVKHLGICAAELGCRVLLIDGDLRQPELHSRFQVPNEQGLSNIIADDLSWQEAVQETNQSNLHLLTAGPIPPNPVALLDSQKMKQLIVQLGSCYDLILMDLSPVVGFADPLVATNYLDALVFLIGLNSATRDMVEASLESLSYTPNQPIGVVCNLAKLADLPHSTHPHSESALSNLRHPLVPNQLIQRLMDPLLRRNGKP